MDQVHGDTTAISNAVALVQCILLLVVGGIARVTFISHPGYGFCAAVVRRCWRLSGRRSSRTAS